MPPDTERLRERLRAMLPELSARYGVAELGVFGSRVRGDHRPDSDLDVLVRFRPDARLSLFDLVELEYTLSDALGVKVDVADRERLRKHIGKYILSEAQPV